MSPATAAGLAEFGAAFGPEATIEGHVRRLWEIYAELRKLGGEASTLQRILDEHMQTTGEVIEVEGLPAMRPVVTGANAHGFVIAARFDKVEYGRCRRCRRRGRELSAGICGNCGDDLRDDRNAEEAGA